MSTVSFGKIEWISDASSNMLCSKIRQDNKTGASFINQFTVLIFNPPSIFKINLEEKSFSRVSVGSEDGITDFPVLSGQSKQEREDHVL